jgi:pyruvate kinase
MTADRTSAAPADERRPAPGTTPLPAFEATPGRPHAGGSGAAGPGPANRAPAADPTRPDPAAVLAEVEALRAAVDREGRATLAGWRRSIDRRAFLPSALNLAHYLAFRRRDLRHLQEALIALGLSSLGRAESRVLTNLDAVRASLARIVGRPAPPPWPPARATGRGLHLLERNTRAVFGPIDGPDPGARRVRIMVTIGAEAAADDAPAHRIVAAGADVVRINCAKGDAETWSAMIESVRRAEAATGRPCRVAMDLCGPRARTAAVVTPPNRHKLDVGDRLLLCRETGPARDDAPFRAVCTLAPALDRVRPGERVTLDEGAVTARVTAVDPDGLLLTVERAAGGGVALKADKGLNFPDTALDLAPLTPKDLADLDVVARRADIVGYSFVQRADDLALLRRELAARRPGAAALPVIAKIETALAVRNLPDLIVEGAGHGPFAVMIARGDLAVEIGWQRLAEIQEELLWLCEAAHVPVVWATQVLNRFVRKGTPARAEITDAAMAERAECVMLNKGPYQADAVAVLDDVLARMAAHQTKKTSRLRALKSW